MAALPVELTLAERLSLYTQLRLYGDRKRQLFECLPLATIGVRYGLAFVPIYTNCVQPLFKCRQCPFQWATELCLSNIASVAPDFAKLMSTLDTHELACSGSRAMARASARGILDEWDFCAAAHELLQRAIFLWTRRFDTTNFEFSTDGGALLCF